MFQCCFNWLYVVFSCDFSLLYCYDLHFLKSIYLFKFILYVGLYRPTDCFFVFVLFCFVLFCFVRSHLFLYRAYLKDGHVLLVFHLCSLFSRLQMYFFICQCCAINFHLTVCCFVLLNCLWLWFGFRPIVVFCFVLFLFLCFFIHFFLFCLFVCVVFPFPFFFNNFSGALFILLLCLLELRIPYLPL